MQETIKMTQGITEETSIKKNKKAVIVCSIVAAICFGIVSYGGVYNILRVL